jgi:hypothetical protein
LITESITWAGELGHQLILIAALTLRDLVGSRQGRAVENRYPTMTLDELVQP